MTPFMLAFQMALGRKPDLESVVEPEPTVEPWTAEEANRHTREIEDQHFMILEPDRNQRRVLSCDQAHYAKFGRSIQRNNCS